MDLKDDIVRRRGLKGSPKVEAKPVVLITDCRFFAKRDKDNQVVVPNEFSEDVWEASKELFAGKCVVVAVSIEQADWFNGSVSKVPADYHVFAVDWTAMGDTTTRLRKRLLELGTVFRPIRNLRSVSILNIHKFVVGDIKVVGIDDHEKLNLTADKEKSFHDFAKLRQRSAWP